MQGTVLAALALALVLQAAPLPSHHLLPLLLPVARLEARRHRSDCHVLRVRNRRSSSDEQ
jgi:hypothetical protein